MIFQQGVDILSHQGQLDRPGKSLQGLVKRIYKTAGARGRRVENLLYGTWLGHPLHTVLTDIAVGAWTAAFAFDVLGALTGGRRLNRCADAATLVGVAAGTGSALAGYTDWQHTISEPRRVGLVHGLMNTGITLLQAGSLLLRVLGGRRAGRAASAVSYGGLIISAYLGGEMVEKYRIGVNRAPVDGVPAGYVPVMAEADLPENEPRQAEAAGVPILLVRQGDRIYAMHATCTHMGGPLPQGAIVDVTIQCPWHASRFALRDGHVVMGPATFPEHCLATRVRNGQIEVGPGAGLGRCRHEPVTAPQAREMAEAAAYR